MDGMADFESVGRGSIPRWGAQNMSLECAGFAREPAKLVDQVRFLAGTLNDAGAPQSWQLCAWSSQARLQCHLVDCATEALGEFAESD